jgi:hypothetical protein
MSEETQGGSAPSFSDAAGEPLTGKAEREAFHGYHQTPKVEEKPEPEVYTGPNAVREAHARYQQKQREMEFYGNLRDLMGSNPTHFIIPENDMTEH